MYTKARPYHKLHHVGEKSKKKGGQYPHDGQYPRDLRYRVIGVGEVLGLFIGIGIRIIGVSDF